MNDRSKDLLMLVGLLIVTLVVVEKMSKLHKKDSQRLPATTYESSIR